MLISRVGKGRGVERIRKTICHSDVTVELWKAQHRSVVTFVVQEYAAVQDSGRIYSHWLQDNNEQKMPTSLTVKL